MKKIVIIGSSFAGLTAAKYLAGSNFEITIVEKKSSPGIKTCASGVTKQDKLYLSDLQINFPFEPVWLIGDEVNERVRMPEGRGLLSSIYRPDIIESWVKDLSEHSNVHFVYETATIITEKSVRTDSGNNYDYDYLIGADGSLSTVRKYLGLKTVKYMAACQYIVPKVYPDFEIYADWELFDKGYAWIFPNKNFTSIGCGLDYSSPNIKKMKKNLHTWLNNKNIDVSAAEFQGFIISYDYQGYKFGNIYLAGDAAGLTNGLTGKGIYAACISGERIAQEILEEAPDDKLERWLIEKNEDENVLRIDGNFVDLKIKSFQ